jgi:predicted DNA-binding transcriptional regulator YafY
VERDISALQQSGVPIYADVGRRGGYALEKSMSLPPLNFTPAEAVALAVAVARSGDGPFAPAGRSALGKILAAMSQRNAESARELVARVRLMTTRDLPEPTPIPAAIEQAITACRALRIGYSDRFGATSLREVEPIALLLGSNGWYLVAWCRLRGEARCFRLDRITAPTLTDTPTTERRLETCGADVPLGKVQKVALG